jgi:predicted subunit of tRNA(5-methylaminomethyl-2-thiouridylate) methyltransferase
VWLIVASGGQDAQNALVLSVVGIGGTLLVTIAAGLFQVWASKRERQEQVPESAQVLLFERTAVLAARADDCDDERAITERRLDQLERRADLDNPNWRLPPVLPDHHRTDPHE